jgi:dephospho-CoA kinase
MRKPIIAVTGGIATGKTTIAITLAKEGGSVIDCDRIGHDVLDTKEARRAVVHAFGKGILTPSGRISRKRLGRIVFADQSELDLLNRTIRPFLKKRISAEVKLRRKIANYIVLDAVLFFQYKFRFKVDLVVRTIASRKTRIERLSKRDGLPELAALARIERHKALEAQWRRADISIRTDGPIDRVIARAERIRNRFIRSYFGSGKEK